MPRHHKNKNKAAAVIFVAALFLAALTAFSLSGDSGGMTDEDLPFVSTFIIASALYFVFIYTLVLIVIGLFKDNKVN